MKSMLKQFLDNIDNSAFNARSVPSTVGDCSAIFWWDDDTPLEEYPFFAADGSECGYAIVSPDRKLPPIHEFALSGPSLSRAASPILASYLASTKQHARNVTWYYLNPLDIIIAIDAHGSSKRRMLKFPEMYSVDLPSQAVFKRDASSVWNPDDVARSWGLVDSSSTSARSIPKILDALAPTPYQQNCRSISQRTGSDHYCEPKCIAGCVPVAWSMYASSRKRSAVGNGSSKIWPNVSCWNIPWPSSVSSTSDPSQCAQVNTTIWDLHNRMDTTCDGSTFDNKWGEARKYFKTTWGLGWEWAHESNVSFDRCVDLLHQDQTFVFGADSDWSAFLEPATSGAVNLPEWLGKVGHAVVGWGEFVSSYTGQEFLLVCLGWGKAFGNEYPGSKWINYSAFSSIDVSFASKYN